MYLSLANAQTFDKAPFIDIPNIDKAVHFCMYFGLMFVIILENKNNIKSNGHLFLVFFTYNFHFFYLFLLLFFIFTV